MQKHELASLEAQIKELRAVIEGSSQTGDCEELIQIIHHPGWTTLAEYMFARGYLTQITNMYRNAAELRHTLVNAAREVNEKTTKATAA